MGGDVDDCGLPEIRAEDIEGISESTEEGVDVDLKD
jgi:hypothetical protein